MAQPQKAYFQRMRDDGVNTVGARLPVMFNPTTFTLTKASQLAEVNVPGLTTPLQQFVRGQAAKLDVELFFDRTDEGTGSLARGVVEDTDRFYDLVRIDASSHAPPVCRFVWGHKFPGSDPPGNESQRSPHFVGVVESVRQELTLFSPKGIPLRARLTVTMREYKTLATQREQLRLNSPNRTHTHVLQRGETLSSVAARYFGDPGNWRPVAEANGIVDPRRVPPGTVLRIPPVDRRQLAVALEA